MNALGIVFSNIHDDNVPELTARRTMASIPFGGRYRLIDFTLSSMVNSNISRVGVITKRNYRSLMDHVGSGKDWDLARKNGGFVLLPPFGDKDSNALYNTRLEALKTVNGFIMRSDEEYVVMADANAVFTADFNEMFNCHVANDADITMLYCKKDATMLSKNDNIILSLADNGRVNEISIDPRVKGKVARYGNICLMKRNLLVTLVNDAIAHGRSHFMNDVLAKGVNRLKIFGYEHTGYFEEISSLERFYALNMELLKPSVRESLFGEKMVFTKIKDSAPTKYGANAIVKNSLISDGCIIEGEVYNSVLFRGVKVSRGTVVKNSVLMQSTSLGEKVSLNAIICDKHVTVGNRRVLSGCETHPFYIPKDSTI